MPKRLFQVPKVSRPRTVVTVVGALLGLATIPTLVGVLLYVGRPAAVAVDPQAPVRRTGAEVRAEAEAKLGRYAWVDKEKGVVRIPIEVAMEKTIGELRRPATVPATLPAGGK